MVTVGRLNLSRDQKTHEKENSGEPSTVKVRKHVVERQILLAHAH